MPALATDFFDFVAQVGNASVPFGVRYLAVVMATAVFCEVGITVCYNSSTLFSPSAQGRVCKPHPALFSPERKQVRFARFRWLGRLAQARRDYAETGSVSGVS